MTPGKAWTLAGWLVELEKQHGRPVGTMTTPKHERYVTCLRRAREYSRWDSSPWYVFEHPIFDYEVPYLACWYRTKAHARYLVLSEEEVTDWIADEWATLFPWASPDERAALTAFAQEWLRDLRQDRA